jgi:hypothetical protein
VGLVSVDIVFVGFEVSTAVTMKNVVFLGVARCVGLLYTDVSGECFAFKVEEILQARIFSFTPKLLRYESTVYP